MALPGVPQDGIRPARILLVEDNPGDVDLVCEALAEAKMLNEMQVLWNGADVLPYLLQQLHEPGGHLPDLILLDLNLPRRNGRQVLEDIRHDPHLRHLPVVVLTTSNEQKDVLNAYALNTNCYIVKPVDFEKLIEVVRQLQVFWLELVALPSGWHNTRATQSGEKQPARARGEASSLEPTPSRGPREVLQVLVVEDNAGDAELMALYLEEVRSPRMIVHSVATASEGMGFLSTHRDVDVILLDLSLPDSSGLDTLFKFRQLPQPVPVVVLTGHDDEGLALQAVQSGAQDWLVKGQVTTAVLVRAIRYAIERSGFEERLRQAHKMEAIGRLAGGVAHDFNNMLAVVLGYTELLEATRTLSEEASGYVKDIRHAGQRASDLTRQLLAFARRQIVTIRPLDVNHLVHSMQRLLLQVTAEETELRLDLAETLPPVRADEGQLEQVLMSLVMNARDAVGQDGIITLSTRLCNLDQRFLRTNVDARPGDYVRLSVTDNGVGMTEEVRSRVFEPFFTTREMGKGTGLGLSTVYAIARQCGGCVDVESESGQGSSFHFYLPASDEPLDVRVEAPRSTPLTGTETILVVEDEPPLLFMTARMLRTAGYQVLEATSADEAMRVSETRSFDLLLTDVVMPGRDGRRLADDLISRMPRLRVLFMTGYSEDVILRKGIQTAERVCVHKPFTAQQLFSAVREVLDSPARDEVAGASEASLRSGEITAFPSDSAMDGSGEFILPRVAPIERLRILVVDDSGPSRQMMGATLSGFHADCQEAASALDAVHQIAVCSFDAIALNLEMEGEMSGLELLQFVRDYVGDIPIVVVSGRDGEDWRTRALEAGANGFVSRGNLAALPEVLARAQPRLR